MNKIEQQIEKLSTASVLNVDEEWLAEECHDAADTMQALLEVAKAAEAHAYTDADEGFATIKRREDALFAALDNLRKVNDE